MDGRAGSEPDWQNNCCISTRKDTSYSILCSSSCRGNDPTSPQSPRTSCPGMKLAPRMGGPPMMPMMGPPPPGIMPVGPAPRMRLPMEATYPRCLGPQWWDLLPVSWWCPPGEERPDQKYKQIGEPLHINFILLALLHQKIMVLWLGVFSKSIKRKTGSPFLSKWQ